MTAGKRLRNALVLLLAACLIVAFGALGTWQLQRRAQKLELIAHVEQQLNRAPVAAPGPAAWPSTGREHSYMPVRVSGRFMHDRETLVQAMTRYGSGHWLLTPLQTERGFTVLVNRGFVDPAHRDPATRRLAQPAGRVEIAGLLRLSEPGGSILQANDVGADRWYYRDVTAIGAARGLALQDLAPYFVDAGGDPNPGSWPVAGLTVVHFRNTHLVYALTWYGLALMSVWGAWIILRERPRALPAHTAAGDQDL